jgi:hypothetical protein
MLLLIASGMIIFGLYLAFGEITGVGPVGRVVTRVVGVILAILGVLIVIGFILSLAGAQ